MGPIRNPNGCTSGILPALDPTQSMTKYASECTEGVGQILNLQNSFDRYCDEIRMKIQTENFFGSLISTRLVQHILVGFGQINVLVRVALWNKVVNGHINQYYLPMEY